MDSSSAASERAVSEAGGEGPAAPPGGVDEAAEGGDQTANDGGVDGEGQGVNAGSEDVEMDEEPKFDEYYGQPMLDDALVQELAGTASAVGIDLGTTFSCVSVWRNGGVEIIPDRFGSRVTPSYVAFTSEQRLIGEEAYNQVAMNPKNSIFDAKRLIGRAFSDPTVQEDIATWPFNISCGADDKPLISISYLEQQYQLAPEEISAMILSRLKDTAEEYLGHPVTKAVITVPAYFSDSQRQATKDAGTIAGLEVLRIINEPTAAAIAYGLDRLDATPSEANDGSSVDDSVITTTERMVLVFDLGGGTFDVSLLGMEEGILEVRATSGDTHLGGEDFDERLVGHLAEVFATDNGFDLAVIRGDPRAMRRLRTAAERAKRALSASVRTRVEVDSLHQGANLSTEVSRETFESLITDLLAKLMKPVQQVLSDSGITAEHVNDVVLVGGSTRVPAVQSALSKFFSGRPLCHGINPDEAVAMGAAVQAALLCPSELPAQEMDERIRDLVLLDVTPLSLGLQTAGGIMTTLIPRNTTIPTRAEKMFSTAVDNQTEVLIRVYEGERAKVADNHHLGSFEMTGITPSPARRPKINVTFDIDVNGILTVWADNKSSGQKERIAIANDKTRLSQSDIETMVDTAERFQQADDEFRLRVEARNSLETYVYSMKGHISKHASALAQDDLEVLMQGIQEGLGWLEINNDAGLDEVQAKHHELRGLLGPMVA